MNGELHHIILITSYTNALLNQGILSEPEAYTNNVHYAVRFIEPHERKSLLKFFSKPANNEFDTLKWMQNIKDRHCKGAFLINSNKIKDEAVTSAFVGGGRRWAIVCVFEHFNEIWVPNWNLAKEPPNTKWDITYTKVISYDEYKSVKYNLDDLSQRLRIALSNISKLAEEISEMGWKERFFDKGIKCLIGEQAEEKNLLPEHYPVSAQRIMNTISCSWVFGGMGSWNDSPPYSAHCHGKEMEYHKYTNELYECMMGECGCVDL
ncbi:ATP-binding protein [Paenibacillus sp. MZ04-78.2]|uniref:ATP-binding protein n=1 Tax=Paenibacillus sp. MZ04-78.2 TaxID=2962034 RepID=UPI0020B85933|nr:ATP-binding protein [Paenibacillus sp. MZ04-78.2]MCP3773753.1 ATP-binding protein [Paenibacillus sp. MZ04-78.2]